MEKVYIFLALAIFVNEAIAMNIRHKRQSNSEDDNALDDRYGGIRPREQWGNVNQPWQQNPGQNQWGNLGQNQNQQWPFPNQNGQNGQNWQNQNGQNGQNWPNQNGQNWPNQNGQNGQNWPNQNGQNLPNQNGQNLPNQNGQNGQNPQPTPTPNASTTQSPQTMACIATCPVTPEYNPVCGSDGTTYSNPGRLDCAQACGLNVSLTRASPCPTTTTTAAPQ